MRKEMGLAIFRGTVRDRRAKRLCGKCERNKGIYRVDEIGFTRAVPGD